MLFFLGDHFHFFSLKEFVFSLFHKNEKKFREINNATQIQLHVLKGMAHITPFLKWFFFSSDCSELRSTIFQKMWGFDFWVKKI